MKGLSFIQEQEALLQQLRDKKHLKNYTLEKEIGLHIYT